MDEKLKKVLEKMHYGIVGDGAVQICRWTKKAIRGEGGCWKEKFYGISSAGCCQMTPNVMNCENMCVHCWRPIEFNLGDKVSKEILRPEELLKGIIKKRKKLLSGFPGNKKIDKQKFKEYLEPSLYTLSLSGEPMLYPYLGELFKLIRKKGAVSFLVTNAQNPEAIKKLKDDELPIQITVSTNAPNKELFNLWHRSCKKDAWEKFLETLDVIKSLKGKVRRVIRLTLVKKGEGKTPQFNEISNMKEKNIKEYANLIRLAEPDFIHIKGFKSVGYSRSRLGYDKQPFFSEVREFSEKLINELKEMKYELKNEDENSCVVLVAKKGKEIRIKEV